MIPWLVFLSSLVVKLVSILLSLLLFCSIFCLAQLLYYTPTSTIIITTHIIHTINSSRLFPTVLCTTMLAFYWTLVVQTAIFSNKTCQPSYIHFCTTMNAYLSLNGTLRFGVTTCVSKGWWNVTGICAINDDTLLVGELEVFGHFLNLRCKSSMAERKAMIGSEYMYEIFT